MKQYSDMTEQEQDAIFIRQRWQIIFGVAALAGVIAQIVSNIS